MNSGGFAGGVGEMFCGVVLEKYDYEKGCFYAIGGGR